MSNETVKPLARTADLVTKEVADEVLVYDLKTHQAHCLNQIALLVWKHCDGQQTVADITNIIAREQRKTVDEAVVWLAIKQLSKANLLEEHVASPEGVPRLGRREAMRRVGTAVAVPIIISIVAPTAQAGCTGLLGIGSGPCIVSNNSTQCCSKCCVSTPSGPICSNKNPTGSACATSPTGDATCCSGSCNPSTKTCT